MNTKIILSTKNIKEKLARIRKLVKTRQPSFRFCCMEKTKDIYIMSKELGQTWFPMVVEDQNRLDHFEEFAVKTN